MFKVGLVTFSDAAYKPAKLNGDDCFSKELAYATPGNKAAFLAYVSNVTISESESSMYSEALKGAKSFLIKGKNDGGKSNIYHFL